MLLVFAMGFITQVSGQNDLTVSGRIKVENGGLKDTKIVIEKNGQRVKTMDADAKFEFQLDFQAVYIISFVKEGYVTKKLRFDTNVPEERIEFGFLAFEFVVSIFKQYEGVNTVIFNQPVGMIAYNETIDEFDYDTDYTKSIQAEIESIQDEIQEKIEEEAEQIEEDRKAQEKLDKEASSLASSGAKNMSSGRFKEAVDDLEKALTLKPEDPELKGKLEEAKKGLDKQNAQIENDKKVAELIVQASGEQEKRNYPEAKKLLEEALKLAPDNKDVSKQLSGVQSQIQDQQEQNQKFDELVQQAKTANQNKNYPEAQKLIEDALSIKPDDKVASDLKTQITNAVAVMEEEKRQKGEQKKAFDDKVAAADKLFDDGKFDEAKKAYQDALGIMDDSDVRNKVSQVEQAVAEKEQQKALEADKKARFDEMLADVNDLIDLEDLPAAGEKLTEASQLFPGNDDLKDAQKKLDDKKSELAKQAEADQERKKEFDKLIADGNKKLTAGDFDKAEDDFNSAKELDESDPRADDGLVAVEKAREDQEALAQAQEEKKAQFEALILQAEAAFDNGEFKESKSLFTQAQGVMEDDRASKGLDKTQAAIDEQNALASAEQEKRAQFDQLMADGENAFGSDDLDLAEDLFTQAQKLLESDEAPKQKLDDVSNRRAELEKVKAAELAEQQAADEAAAKKAQYDELIVSGDEAFNNEDFEVAKGDYEKAAKLLPDESYPTEQIQEIEQKLSELAANAEAAAAQAAIDEQYNDLVAAGDKAFEKDELDAAEKSYTDALAVKDEAYPKDQLAAIASKREAQLAELANAEAAAAQAAIDEQYNDLVAAGDKAFEKDELDAAEKSYTDALAVKDEAYPKDQLAAIASKREAQLAELANAEAAAAQAAIDQQYNDLIDAGDKAFEEDELDAAEKSYTEALTVKDEAYPKDQLAAIASKREALLAELANAEAAAAQAAIDEQYNDLVAAGDKAFEKDELDAAEKSYTEALTVKDEAYPKDQLAAIASKREAQLAESANAEAAAAQAAIDEQYNDLVAAGDKAFGKDELDAAEKSYTEALTVKDEAYPKDQLAAIASKREAQLAESANAEAAAAQAAIDEQYNDLIAIGDKAFEKDELDAAEKSYTEALTVKDEAYPKDQLTAIGSKREALLAESANAEAAAAQAAIDEQYNDLVAAGDKAFEKDELDAAEKSYTEALAIKDETYPKDQLAVIVSKREALLAESANAEAAAQAAIDAQYNDLVAVADKAFGKENLDEAEKSYTEALAIKDETYPKDQLAAIGSKREALLAESANAEAAAAQAAIDEQYNDLVATGDKAFEKDELDAAEKSYTEALTVKDEAYPKDQLAAIASKREALLAESANAEAAAAQAGIEEQYADLISSGDKAFGKNDLDKAEESYTEALTVKDETYPKDQLAVIAAKRQALAAESANVEAIAAQAGIDKQYNELIAAADKAFGKDDLDDAEKSYSEALALKDEAYPKEQLDVISQTRSELEAVAAARAKEKALSEQEANYSGAIAEADDLFENEDWSDAIVKYNEALSVKEDEYPKNQIAIANEKLNQLALEAAEKESRKQYEQLVDEAGDLFQANKLQESRDTYGRALSLYDEEIPKQRIAKIDKILETRQKQSSSDAAKALANAKAGGEASELANIIESESTPARSDASPTVELQNSTKKAASGVIISDPKPLKQASGSASSDDEFEQKVFEGIEKRIEQQQIEGVEEQSRSELASKYPARKTVESEKVGNSIVTYVYINENGYVTTYKKVEHNWGGVYYFVDDRATSQRFWDHHTE